MKNSNLNKVSPVASLRFILALSFFSDKDPVKKIILNIFSLPLILNMDNGFKIGCYFDTVSYRHKIRIELRERLLWQEGYVRKKIPFFRGFQVMSRIADIFFCMNCPFFFLCKFRRGTKMKEYQHNIFTIFERMMKQKKHQMISGAQLTGASVDNFII